MANQTIPLHRVTSPSTTKQNFATSGVSRLIIDDSGKIGIGITSPAQRLHVSSGSGASTIAQFGEAYDTSVKIKATNTASAMLNFMNAADTTVWSAGFRNDSGDGVFRIRKAATLDAGGHRHDFGADGSLNVIPNNAAATISIQASASGNDAELRFSTALNGRGIYLDDSATNTLKIYTGHGKGTANREVMINNDGDLSIGATRKLYLDSLGDTYIQEYSANEMGFYTGGAQRLKLSGGNVYPTGPLVWGGSSGTDFTINNSSNGGLVFLADNNGHVFKTYESTWKSRLEIEDTGEMWHPEVGGAVSDNDGSYTSHIGSISQGNSGNRYLHVRIPMTQNTMFMIMWNGHEYATAKGGSGWFVGYHYGGNGVIQQEKYSDTANIESDSIYMVGGDASNADVGLVIDTNNSTTGNRWGGFHFHGSMDTIVANYPFKIAEYAWSASTSDPF